MRPRRAPVVMAILAWLAGSALGTASDQRPIAHSVALQISRAHARYVPVLTGDEPLFILLIGGDARPGDDPSHSLADSIHVLAIHPVTHRATILGIPRDTWVEVPGRGMGKINSTMASGGPALLVRTIEGLMGIRIAYYAVTTFEGVVAHVDTIGGLRVRVPCAMNDPFSKSTFEPGLQRLNGEQVLAFARDRHSFVAGDLARSENGGRLILSALSKFQKGFVNDPSALLMWLASGLRNVQTDVPLAELVVLAFTAYAIDVSEVQNVVLPTSAGVESALYVEYADPSAQRIFEDLARGATVRPSHVQVSPTEDAC